MKTNRPLSIRVDSIAKRYRIGAREQRADSLGAALLQTFISPWRNFRKYQSLYRFDNHGERATGQSADPSVLWALQGVSFDVTEGEVVGIIGNNGAGKSTLLKILSRITTPTRGRIEIHGRIASLLEVGTGFHPELTGRENIFLNGVILGMKKKEVERRFDEIIDFSGIERFLDTPVKRYSSGMKVRLGFAVAAHLQPEILIIDEVLAVGDAEFQRKCLGKMTSVAREGRTVLFVSHNMAAVRDLCPRAILMKQGIAVMDGPSDQVIDSYLRDLAKGSRHAFSTNNPERTGSGEVRMTGATVLDSREEPTEFVIAGQDIAIEFCYENHSGAKRADFCFTIYNQLGVAVTSITTEMSEFIVKDLKPHGTIRCHIPRVALPLGRYHVSAMVKVAGKVTDHIHNALTFEVAGSEFFTTGRTYSTGRYCTVLMAHAWEHSARSVTASHRRTRRSFEQRQPTLAKLDLARVPDQTR